MVIDEPLELSAPLARQLASRLCRKNPATEDSCEWDHGFWQYLCILGLAAAHEPTGFTPAQAAAFCAAALKRAT
jgi:hypothetical protein